MSTNAVIRVEGVSHAQLYKHHDGYPSATLFWLEEFNRDFAEKRGDDPDYKFAQLLRSSARDAEKYNLDDSLHTGWGVSRYDGNAGHEFEYTLKRDGTVTWREV